MMAKQETKAEIHNSDSSDSLLDLDVSVDLIDDNLYLGNLASARDVKTLEKLGITHILTIDVVPLPRSTLERPNYVFKFIKLADVPKEDLISHLPEATDFINDAITAGGTVLVHCYFGISRSAAAAVAHVMRRRALGYGAALAAVRARRRVQPNVGFAAQLRLYGQMGCRVDKEDPRYKQFRLRIAGQKLREVKILPLELSDLVRADPGLARERPRPAVYRCRRCRRVLADQGNIIPHLPKDVRTEMELRRQRPAASAAPGLPAAAPLLLHKLRDLAARLDAAAARRPDDDDDDDDDDEAEEGPSHLDGHTETSPVDASVARAGAGVCRRMWFVEPVAWMQGVRRELHGKLSCPKCQSKIGSFNWVMGCKCPCGQKVAPAFYLVPSKVEWSNIVQNVQVTV